ncbi:hypothetical protein PR048_021836 [Dryococelus australis]|uniref:Uncharacterized protein n=1 Tax=Dryococelus australis TaxID=614101 RepID=A0ABQ9GZA9_9NEOP|nr:hypothetical protein PR048_021836 [Dryococelus australis]
MANPWFTGSLHTSPTRVLSSFKQQPLHQHTRTCCQYQPHLGPPTTKVNQRQCLLPFVGQKLPFQALCSSQLAMPLVLYTGPAPVHHAVVYGIGIVKRIKEMPNIPPLHELQREFKKDGFYIFDETIKVIMCKYCDCSID